MWALAIRRATEPATSMNGSRPPGPNAADIGRDRGRKCADNAHGQVGDARIAGSDPDVQVGEVVTVAGGRVPEPVRTVEGQGLRTDERALGLRPILFLVRPQQVRRQRPGKPHSFHLGSYIPVVGELRVPGRTLPPPRSWRRRRQPSEKGKPGTGCECGPFRSPLGTGK